MPGGWRIKNIFLCNEKFPLVDREKIIRGLETVLDQPCAEWQKNVMSVCLCAQVCVWLFTVGVLDSSKADGSRFPSAAWANQADPFEVLTHVSRDFHRSSPS